MFEIISDKMQNPGYAKYNLISRGRRTSKRRRELIYEFYFYLIYWYDSDLQK
jgi:hypothetical protein